MITPYNRNPPPLSSTQIEDLVQTIARFHEEHHQNSSRFQKFVDRLTARLGRPTCFFVLTVLIVGWIVWNLFMSFDPPPFNGLALVVSLVSFYIVLLILVTQKREDELALHREQLLLEVLVSSEHKATKVIRMLEELRKDSPFVDNRRDQEAEEMSNPANASEVMNAIKDIHARTEVRDT